MDAVAIARPLQLSFVLPRNPHGTLHLHLTFLPSSVTLFLTLSSLGDPVQTVAPMGSFVYALPDVRIASLTQLSAKP